MRWKISNILFAWKTVFKHKSYIFLALIIALFFYVFNALLNNITNIIGFYRQGFGSGSAYVWNLIIGFGDTVLLHGLISVIVLGLLTGMLISLIVFKYKLTVVPSKKKGFLGGVGIFLGFLVPGCASCGIGLVAILGLGGALATLPYNGQELTVIAILFIGFAILKFSNDIFMCKNKLS